MSQLSKVSCKYGAPMGRPSYGVPENCAPRSVHLYRLRLDSGGYDSGGAYWGHGAPLYLAWADDDRLFQTVRAPTRAAAAEALGLTPDLLKRPERAS